MTQPMADALRYRAEQRFEVVFGTSPMVSAHAPGRANLMGEHCDYNDGPVLPVTLPIGTAIAMGPGRDGWLEAVSGAFEGVLARPIDAPPNGDWLDYPMGCIAALHDAGLHVPGLRIAIESDLPVGAGLSSSAALEVAFLRAFRRFSGGAFDNVALARLGQWGESRYVGMPCGIMDQMVVSVGEPGAALFLDTSDLSVRSLPIPSDWVFEVVHCGVPHELVDGGYANRLAQCRAAAGALKVASLAQLTLEDLVRGDALEAPLGQRVRHVVTEIHRVHEAVHALEAGDAELFGRLMVASHHSQAEDYAVSIPDIDRLQVAAMDAGALGARLTGGGFGGSIVALVPSARTHVWREDVKARYDSATFVATTRNGR